MQIDQELNKQLKDGLLEEKRHPSWNTIQEEVSMHNSLSLSLTHSHINYILDSTVVCNYFYTLYLFVVVGFMCVKERW